MSKSALIAACLLLAVGSSRGLFAQHVSEAPTRGNLPKASVVNWVQPDADQDSANDHATVKRSGFDPVMELDHSNIASTPTSSETSEASDDDAVSVPMQTSQSRGKGRRYRVPADQRAGSPRNISKLAQASPNSRYQLGFVGGGSALFGTSRQVDQGVFGMDYAGLNPFRTVWLKWNNGERNQGGAGAYKTDGRKILEH